MKSRRGCVRSSERLWKKTVERLVVGRIPQLARLLGVAVPSLLRNRARRWGEKQIIQGFDRVFTQSGEWLGAHRLRELLCDDTLGEYPKAGYEQTTDCTETQTLQKSDKVEAVVAVAGHPLSAGKDHLPRLNRAEEEPVEDDQIEYVEDQESDGGECECGYEVDVVEVGPQGK